MTITINDLTDFTLVEDAIADFVEEISQLPEIEGRTKTSWSGFDFARVRPYATLEIVTQRTVGKPWTRRADLGTGNDIIKQKILYHPYHWSVDITFYTDAYDDDGVAIRETARFYAQRMQNRAFIPSVRSFLDAQNIAYGQVGSVMSGSVGQEEDQFIHQASIEFRFSGIAQTEITDTDFFTSVTDPTITLSGE